jgi:hypothetical protein
MKRLSLPLDNTANKIFNKPIIKTKGLKLFKEEHTLFKGAPKLKPF